jgi:hypothetical protein
MRRPHVKPTASMAVALTALVVALGGTSYAALELPADSVDTTAIKNYAVTHSKVASDAITTSRVQDGSLEAKDFKAGQIPQGPAGAPGARGPAGPAGPSGANGKGVLAWAAIDADGTIREAFNLEQSNLAHTREGTAPDPETGTFPRGTYCFKNLRFVPKALQLTVADRYKDYDPAGYGLSFVDGIVGDDDDLCREFSQAVVTTWGMGRDDAGESDGVTAPHDRSFYIAFYG